jgi:hypothetical protein
MNKLKALLITLTLILCCSISALAQDKETVCAQIENSVRTKAPLWKLERRSRPCKSSMVYFEWVSGKSEIYAFIYTELSSKEAIGTFEFLEIEDEIFLEKIQVFGTGLREFGEDNRLFIVPKVKRAGVDFRKGKTIVRISASTLELAIQFAAHIAEAIPAP